MPILALAGALLLASPQFDVNTLDGQALRGKLVAASATEITIETEAGQRRLATSTLIAVAAREPAKAQAPPAFVVELTDGSRLAAASFRASKSTATIALVGKASVQIPTRAIRSVRAGDLQAADAKLAQQWSEFAESKVAADLVVVRKPTALDAVEGVLKDIDQEKVDFDVDGSLVPVKWAKVAGLIYYHPPGEPLPEPICEASDVHGAHLAVRSLALAGDKLEITTPAAVQFVWPVEALVRLDFSSRNVRYLSDLEPDSVEYAPFVAGGGQAPLVAAGGLRRDVGLEQNPLVLGGVKYAKGVALRSRTTAVYRLTGKYRKLTAVAGIDDSVRDSGHVAVRIKGDEKTLWEATLSGADPPRPIDVDLAGARKLEIFVDYGEDQDVADHFDLCDAKLLK